MLLQQSLCFDASAPILLLTTEDLISGKQRFNKCQIGISGVSAQWAMSVQSTRSHVSTVCKNNSALMQGARKPLTAVTVKFQH